MPARESSVPSNNSTGGGPTPTTTPSAAEIRSALSHYFSAASKAADFYISATDVVNSLPTGSSKKRSNENEILRRDTIELSNLVEGGLAAAEVVPGVSEVEIGVALGSEVLSQFEQVKSAVGNLIDGLESMKDLITEWATKPTTLRQALGALMASSSLLTIAKTLKLLITSIYAEWDTALPPTQPPPPTQIIRTSTTSTSSSTSQKPSEKSYVFYTNNGTPNKSLAALLATGPPTKDITYFDTLQIQIVVINLTDSLAKKFSASPIVSVASFKYEFYR
jgi:hypothetical protein